MKKTKTPSDSTLCEKHHESVLKSIRKSVWTGALAILPFTVAGLLLFFTLTLWTCSTSNLVTLDAPSIGGGEEPWTPYDGPGSEPPGGDDSWEPGDRGEPKDEGEPENGDDDHYYYLEDTEPTAEDMEYGEHPAGEYDTEGLEPTSGYLPRTDPDPVDAYARALDNLRDGNVVYPERQEMRQGLVKPVSVRVYYPGSPVSRSMEEHEVVEVIRVSNVMCADLVDPEGAFQISPMTERCQVTARPHTEWLWAVLPSLSGEHQMVLTITNEISVSGNEKYRTEIAKMAIIDVEIDLWYVTNGFLKAHWKWIILGCGGIGGIFGFVRGLFRRKKKERQEAGF